MSWRAKIKRMGEWGKRGGGERTKLKEWENRGRGEEEKKNCVFR